MSHYNFLNNRIFLAKKKNHLTINLKNKHINQIAKYIIKILIKSNIFCV